MLDHWLSFRLFEDSSIDLHGSDQVWIDVGGGSSVFDVALAICVCGGGRNAEGSGSVSYAKGELIDIGRLMVAGHSLLVVVSIKADMKVMLDTKALHHAVDVVHSLRSLTHGLR